MYSPSSGKYFSTCELWSEVKTFSSINFQGADTAAAFGLKISREAFIFVLQVIEKQSIFRPQNHFAVICILICPV